MGRGSHAPLWGSKGQSPSRDLGRRPGLSSFTLLLCLLAVLPWPAAAAPDPAAALRQGVNITGWFRFPASRDPAALRVWLSDRAIADIAGAGFSFVRLAVDPAILDGPPMRQVLVDAVRRLQRRGLAVIVSPHPVTWSLDTSAADRGRLEAFWRDLAPMLRQLPPGLTFPEVVNEPVFHADPSIWWALQHRLLTAIRADLPINTIILTGNDWGSIGGLLAMKPESDRNVVYSFHFYDPPELTSLAAYRPGLDRVAMSHLPFPAKDAAGCEAASIGTTDEATRGLIHFYCGMNRDEARIRDRLLAAVSWARVHGTSILAGEFGASVMLNAAARLAWLRLVRTTCAENGIGWALWGYDDSMGLNVSRPPPARPGLDPPVLAALGLHSP